MSEDAEDERLGSIPRRAREAAEALEGLAEPADRAADAIGDAFDRAAESLARSLGRAAADGEITLAELARTLLSVINAAAGSGAGGLSSAIAGAVGGLFSGSRADGGPVAPGGAYLVGERGPEIFRPSGAGAIETTVGGGVTVNVRVEGGVQAVLRSETQIAQALSRAVLLGSRRL